MPELVTHFCVSSKLAKSIDWTLSVGPSIGTLNHVGLSYCYNISIEFLFIVLLMKKYAIPSFFSLTCIGLYFLIL